MDYTKIFQQVEIIYICQFERYWWIFFKSFSLVQLESVPFKVPMKIIKTIVFVIGAQRVTRCQEVIIRSEDGRLSSWIKQQLARK